MFNSLTSYNESLNTLNAPADSPLNLADSEHRVRLLKWLNDWGCRHLAKEQHHVASESIREWYEAEGRTLASIRKHLWLLDDAELSRLRWPTGL